MSSLEYAIKLTPDINGGFVVTCRDLPEVITQGESIEDALSEAQDALDEAFAVRIDDALDIPQPTHAQEGEYLASPPIETQLKAYLYLEIRKTNTSKSELARRLNVNEKSVRRLLDPHHATKLPKMVDAMAALGKRLDIKVRDNSGKLPKKQKGESPKASA